MVEKAVMMVMVVAGSIIWLTLSLFILKKAFKGHSLVSQYYSEKKATNVKKKKSRSKKR